MFDVWTPAELRARLDAGEELVLLDVREPEELAICRLEDVVHIPLGELASRCDELDPEKRIVCICHHGLRSGNAAAFLMTRDFDEVANLAGGMDRWAIEVDPGTARY